MFLTLASCYFLRCLPVVVWACVGVFSRALRSIGPCSFQRKGGSDFRFCYRIVLFLPLGRFRVSFFRCPDPGALSGGSFPFIQTFSGRLTFKPLRSSDFGVQESYLRYSWLSPLSHFLIAAQGRVTSYYGSTCLPTCFHTVSRALPPYIC